MSSGSSAYGLAVRRDQRVREIRDAQVRLLYANADVAVGVTILVSSALTYLEWDVIPHSTLWSWLACMIVVSVARFALTRSYYHVAPTNTYSRGWGVAFTLGAGLSAAGWGAAGVFLYPVAHLANQVLLAFVLGGMMLGGGAILAARLEAFLAFLIPSGLPSAVRFLVHGDNWHLAMGLLMLLFTAATLTTTFHIYQAVGSSLRLRFENNDLVGDLQVAKQHLETLNQQLEERVEERTAELGRLVLRLRTEIADRQRAEEERAALEASLRHSQKLEAIGVLAGGIAHEFNNLLTSIAGYTTLVRDSLVSTPETSEHLEEVLKASARAGNLVRRLLVFSHKSEHKPELVPVAAAVSEALDLVGSTLPSSISFRRRIDPGSGYIFADPNLVQQIVVNLCANSYEAMSGEAGQLEVTLAPVELGVPAPAQSGLADGPYVKLTVQDTGPGIPSEIADRLFEPFFTTKPAGKGTGLGLSVVHGIVTTYGGLITFESRPPEGATFAVFLPRLPAPEETPAEKTESPATRTHRVLFVDDEAAVARLGALVLSSLGHSVTSRTSSVEALRLFETQPDSFDLVITDLTMPQMTGKELIRKLKMIRVDIPVILMSGFNDASVTVNEADLLGIGDFVGKPFTASSLTEAIRKALQKKRDSRPTV